MTTATNLTVFRIENITNIPIINDDISDTDKAVVQIRISMNFMNYIFEHYTNNILVIYIIKTDSDYNDIIIKLSTENPKIVFIKIVINNSFIKIYDKYLYGIFNLLDNIINDSSSINYPIIAIVKPTLITNGKRQNIEQFFIKYGDIEYDEINTKIKEVVKEEELKAEELKAKELKVKELKAEALKEQEIKIAATIKKTEQIKTEPTAKEIEIYEILINECKKDIEDIKAIIDINNIDDINTDTQLSYDNFMKLDFLSYKLYLLNICITFYTYNNTNYDKYNNNETIENIIKIINIVEKFKKTINSENVYTDEFKKKFEGEIKINDILPSFENDGHKTTNYINKIKLEKVRYIRIQNEIKKKIETGTGTGTETETETETYKINILILNALKIIADKIIYFLKINSKFLPSAYYEHNIYILFNNVVELCLIDFLSEYSIYSFLENIEEEKKKEEEEEEKKKKAKEEEKKKKEEIKKIKNKLKDIYQEQYIDFKNNLIIAKNTYSHLKSIDIYKNNTIILKNYLCLNYDIYNIYNKNSKLNIKKPIDLKSLKYLYSNSKLFNNNNYKEILKLLTKNSISTLPTETDSITAQAPKKPLPALPKKEDPFFLYENSYYKGNIINIIKLKRPEFNVDIKKQILESIFNNNILSDLDEDTVILDPAGLHIMSTDTLAGGGLSRQIYNLLKDKNNNFKDFYKPMSHTTIYSADNLDIAKFKEYATTQNTKLKIIHSIGPNFSIDDYDYLLKNDDLYKQTLQKIYDNIVNVFIEQYEKNNNLKLRLCVLSGGIFANRNENKIFSFTAEIYINLWIKLKNHYKNINNINDIISIYIYKLKDKSNVPADIQTDYNHFKTSIYFAIPAIPTISTTLNKQQEILDSIKNNDISTIKNISPKNPTMQPTPDNRFTFSYKMYPISLNDLDNLITNGFPIPERDSLINISEITNPTLNEFSNKFKEIKDIYIFKSIHDNYDSYVYNWNLTSYVLSPDLNKIDIKNINYKKLYDTIYELYKTNTEKLANIFNLILVPISLGNNANGNYIEILDILVPIYINLFINKEQKEGNNIFMYIYNPEKKLFYENLYNYFKESINLNLVVSSS